MQSCLSSNISASIFAFIPSVLLQWCHNWGKPLDSLSWTFVHPWSNKMHHFCIHHILAVNLDFLSVNNIGSHFFHIQKEDKNPYLILGRIVNFVWYEYEFLCCQTQAQQRFSNAKWRHQFDHHPTTPLWLLHTSLWLLNTSKSKSTQRSRNRWAKHLHSCQLPSVVHTQLYSVQVVLKYDTLLSLCCLRGILICNFLYPQKKCFF